MCFDLARRIEAIVRSTFGDNWALHLQPQASRATCLASRSDPEWAFDKRINSTAIKARMCFDFAHPIGAMFGRRSVTLGSYTCDQQPRRPHVWPPDQTHSGLLTTPKSKHGCALILHVALKPFFNRRSARIGSDTGNTCNHRPRGPHAWPLDQTHSGRLTSVSATLQSLVARLLACACLCVLLCFFARFCYLFVCLFVCLLACLLSYVGLCLFECVYSYLPVEACANSFVCWFLFFLCARVFLCLRACAFARLIVFVFVIVFVFAFVFVFVCVCFFAHPFVWLLAR